MTQLHIKRPRLLRTRYPVINCDLSMVEAINSDILLMYSNTMIFLLLQHYTLKRIEAGP